MPRAPLSTLGLACSVALCALSGRARATVLYATGFESPDFSPGQFTPQQGWLTTASTFSAQAAVVGTANPRSGAQSVSFDSTFIPQADWFFKPLGYTVTAAEPIVRVSVDMFLTNTAVNSAGWGIDCYDNAGVRIGEFYVDGNGIGSISDGNTTQPAALAGRNLWDSFVFTLDFTQRRFTLSLNGQTPIGSMAFNAAAGSSLGDADIHVFNAGVDTAYFDNFSVDAVPGPLSAVGLAAPCALMLTRRRRRPVRSTI